MIHTIPLEELRLRLAALCSEVNKGKKELVVTRYGEPLFKVVKYDNKADVVVGLTYMRDHTREFIKALEDHKTVGLSKREVPLVNCVLL
jgi:prevent-host-death family protein